MQTILEDTAIAVLSEIHNSDHRALTVTKRLDPYQDRFTHHTVTRRAQMTNPPFRSEHALIYAPDGIRVYDVVFGGGMYWSSIDALKKFYRGEITSRVQSSLMSQNTFERGVNDMIWYFCHMVMI